jgi:hypothetical protein
MCSLGNEVAYSGMKEELVLTQPQQEYLDWLCTAPSERTPPSKNKMAVHLGVDITTLRRWEKKPNFRKQWQDKVDDIQGSPERTQAVLDMLYNKATQDNDVKSAQLYLQATNRMAPPTVEVKSDRKLTELSDAELDALIASVASREKETRTLKVV